MQKSADILSIGFTGFSQAAPTCVTSTQIEKHNVISTQTPTSCSHCCCHPTPQGQSAATLTSATLD